MFSAGAVDASIFNSERELLDRLDTEPTVTIGAIRQYLIREYPPEGDHTTYRLYYNNQCLDNDNLTLADYGWAIGMSGTITALSE